MNTFTTILLLALVAPVFTACNSTGPNTSSGNEISANKQIFTADPSDAVPTQASTVDTLVKDKNSQKEVNAEYFDTPCVDNIQSHLSVMPDNFTIQPTVDNKIEGKKGTVVIIPANSLQFKNGKSPQGHVNINLTECYTMADILGENLQTLSNGKMLETGGMVRVLATSGGRELVMKEGSAFKVAMPQQGMQSGMQLFYGQEISDKPVNWLLAANDNQAQTVNASSLDMPLQVPQAISPIQRETQYQLSVHFHTTGIGYGDNMKDITYLLLDQDETLHEYVLQNFEISNELRQAFSLNNQSKKAQVEFTIDKTGKIVSAEILGIKGLFSRQLRTFLLTKTPRLDIESMYPQNFNTKYSFGLSAREGLDKVKFKKKFEEKFRGNEDRPMSDVNKADLNYYLFSATKFGWINCDRFYDNPAPKVDLIVDVPNPKNTKIMIAFESVRSVMQGSLVNNRWVFRNLPNGEKVKVIAISYRENWPVLAVEKSTVSDQSLSINSFNAFSLNELTSELNSLN